MRKYRSTIVGFAILLVLMTSGAAQSLSGSNTVFTDDIAPKQVYGSDIADNAVSGSKVYPNSITGADVNEATLSPRTSFAQVKYSGGSVSASPGVTSSRSDLGKYVVTFPRSMSGCSATANPAWFRGATIASVALQAYVEMGTSSSTAAGSNQVGVIMTANTNQQVDSAFVLTAVCP